MSLRIDRIFERIETTGMKESEVATKLKRDRRFFLDLRKGMKKSINAISLYNLAKLTDTDVDYFMGRQDVPKLFSREGVITRGRIRISGVVGVGGSLDFSAKPGSLGVVPIPEDGADWRAVVVSENSIQPLYRAGDILCYHGKGCSPLECEGMECLIMMDGAYSFRIVWKGEERGFFDLTSPVRPALTRCRLEWCAPIAWVRKPVPAG